MAINRYMKPPACPVRPKTRYFILGQNRRHFRRGAVCRDTRRCNGSAHRVQMEAATQLGPKAFHHSNGVLQQIAV